MVSAAGSTVVVNVPVFVDVRVVEYAVLVYVIVEGLPFTTVLCA